VYLTTFAVAQNQLRWMIGLLMNNELERVWKETVIAVFKVLFRHLPGGTEESRE
jgi:hypothetical protein